MHIHIMPVKQLLSLDLPSTGAAAIISTSAAPDTSRFPCPYLLAEYLDLDYDSPRSFSPEQAAGFAGFIRQLDRTTELYICCDAGESRSPAIAAATERWLCRSDRYIWESPRYHPNALCFCRMLEAFGLSITDEALDMLIQTNRMAFKNALAQARKGGNP